MRGVNYAPYIDLDADAPQANDNLEKNQNGMSFRVYLNGELPPPRAGSEVVWVWWDTVADVEVTGGREFAGVIASVKETQDGATLVYDVDCRSYERWLDRRLVTGFFQQQAAETTIKQIINAYCPGFTYNNVSAPYEIVAQYFQYQRPSNCIRNVCDQLGIGWYVDYERDVHTYAVENFPSPLPNNILDIDNDHTNYGDLELSEDADSVYNRFVVRGYKQRSKYPFTLRFRGDGTTTQWNLGYRFSSAKGDSIVTVGGVDFPVKRDILDGLPGQSNDPTVAYVHWTQHTVRFSVAPSDGTIVEFTGYPLVDKTRSDQDDASIEYMRELENTPASDGIYEFAEIDKSLSQSTTDAITAKMQLMALKYGFPTLSGSFTTYLRGWRAGQSFRMTSAFRMGGLSADDRYYVYRVTKRWLQAFEGAPASVQYAVEFANKPYLI